MRKISHRQLLSTFISSIAVLAIIAATSLALNIPISVMTRDVAAIGNIHPLYGFLSSIGIILWSAVVSVCLFTASILRTGGQREMAKFLYWSALLTLYLLLDDLFQIHEALASQYLSLNENIIYAILAVTLCTYLITFKQLILTTHVFLLVLAFGLLGLSVVIDSIPQQWLQVLGHWKYFFEDGLKWLGIVAWCSYYFNTSYQFLENQFSQPNNAI